MVNEISHIGYLLTKCLTLTVPLLPGHVLVRDQTSQPIWFHARNQSTWALCLLLFSLEYLLPQFQCSAHTLLLRLSSATPSLEFPPLIHPIWKKYIIFFEFPCDISKSSDISSISPFYNCYNCLWFMSDVTVVIPLRAELFPIYL